MQYNKFWSKIFVLMLNYRKTSITHAESAMRILTEWRYSWSFYLQISNSFEISLIYELENCDGFVK